MKLQKNLGQIEMEAVGRAIILLSDKLYPHDFELYELEVIVPEGVQFAVVRNGDNRELVQDGDELVEFFTLPSGHQGTKDELIYDYENNNIADEDLPYFEEMVFI